MINNVVTALCKNMKCACVKCVKTLKLELYIVTTTLKCVLDIKDYQIDFAVENSLRTVLGFDAKIYKGGRHESENLIDMSVNSILVHCDIIDTSRVNGIEAPVIYNFIPNAVPAYKIVITPKNLIYAPITLNVISHMTCWLTDQNGGELDLRGEELTITFHIKACS